MQPWWSSITKRFGKILGLVGIVASMTGCASIVSGGPATIPIDSNPSDARLVIYDVRTGDEVISTRTPHEAILKRGAGYFKGAKYRVVVEKEGFKRQELMIKSELNGWYIGNLLFGGLIGLVIVDPLTGAMWILRPKDIQAELTEGTALLRDQKGLVFMLKEQLPNPHVLQHAVQILPPRA